MEERHATVCFSHHPMEERHLTNGRKTCNDVLFTSEEKHATMCFHIMSAFVLSKTTQSLPAQSTHSSFSPESSDAADPTQPLAKAADTATRGPTPQWHRLRSSKGDTPGKRIKKQKEPPPFLVGILSRDLILALLCRPGGRPG